MTDDVRDQDAQSRDLAPETLAVSHGYDPWLFRGAVKPPLVLTSTFAFRTAEEGRDFFDVVAGRKPSPPGGPGLVYARFDHPNAQIVEDRLSAVEGGEAALVFNSGMAAITTAILAVARPGDVILHSQPLYGGTETLLGNTLARLGIAAHGFSDGANAEAIHESALAARRLGRLSVILIEMPSNPLNTLVDIAAVRAVAE